MLFFSEQTLIHSMMITSSAYGYVDNTPYLTNQSSLQTAKVSPSQIGQFEKSGAQVLDNHGTIIDLTPQHLSTTSLPDMDLIKSHFHVVLMIHVRGFHKEAVVGFKATMLS